MSENNSNWNSVDITVPSGAAEAVEFAFNEAGACGTQIDLLGKRQPPTETVVSGYFEGAPDLDALRIHVSNSLRVHGLDADAVISIKVLAVPNQDWLAEWKKHWRPTGIGRFVIAPPWENVEGSDKIVIRIEPNMAFGTGTHDTTKLCLKAIGEKYLTGQTVLDVGTGTGILAIAAAKLGAKTISACDTDIDSVKIARENAVLNEADWIEFAEGSLAMDAPVHDFVVANLTIDVIVPIVDLLLAKSGSILLLSGILAEQQPIIVSEFENRGIKEFAVEQSGEWISVVVEQ